jgi:hypothetical protein
MKEYRNIYEKKLVPITIGADKYADKNVELMRLTDNYLKITSP